MIFSCLFISVFRYYSLSFLFQPITALFTFFHSFFLPLSLWQQRSDSLSLIESRWARKTGRGEGPIKVWSLSSFLTCFYSPPAWALHSTVCVRIYRCFLNQTVSKIMLWLIYSHSDANETCLICLKSGQPCRLTFSWSESFWKCRKCIRQIESKNPFY